MGLVDVAVVTVVQDRVALEAALIFAVPLVKFVVVSAVIYSIAVFLVVVVAVFVRLRCILVEVGSMH